MKRNTKLLIFSLFISSLTYGGMKDDITFLNELYRQERYEMAIQESKKFLTIYPDSKYNKDLCKRIGVISYLNGNYGDAKIYFDKYITNYKLKKSEKDEAYSYFYRISLLEKDSTKASYYKKILQQNKEMNEMTDYESGIILLNNGRNEEALSHFNEAISLNGKNLKNSYLYQSLVLLNLGQYKNALNSVNIYNNMEGQDKDLPLVTYLYGVLNYRLNDINKAIDYLETGLKNFPTDSYSLKGRLVLIEIYLNRSEAPKAIRLYSQLTNKNDIVKASKVFGNFFVTKGEYTRAIDYFDKIQNKDQQTQYVYAYSYFKENNFERALTELSKINDEKFIKDANYYKILSYYELKNYVKALEFESKLENYTMDSKKYNDVRIVFANSAYELGYYKKAYDYYTEIYKDYPEIENLYRMMVIGKKLDDEKIMEEILAKYKESFPQDKVYKKDIYVLLGEFYYKNNKLLKAENTYKEFLKTDKNTEVTNKLVDLLVNEKKYTEVIEYLNTLEPNDENQYLKGIAYMGIGNYKKADEFFDGLNKKENVEVNLSEKIKYSTIKNNFLWEKYDSVISQGKEYIKNKKAYREDDIVDILGITYYRQEDFKTAREYFEILQGYKGRYSYSKYQIADTYFAEKDYKNALSLYEEIGKNKNYQKDYREGANYWKLQCYLYLNNRENFLKESEEFAKVYPKSSYIKNLMIIRGKILVEDGKLDVALEEYKKLYSKLKTNEEKDLTLEKIIDISLMTDEKKEVKTWIDKLNDKYKKAYYSSIYYRNNDMLEEARKSEKILLETNTYKDYALKNLADDEYSNKNYKEALKYYQELDKLDVSSYKDYALFMIGDIYSRDNKNEDAVVILTKVFVLYPQSDYVIPSKIKIAEIFEKTKDYDKAIKAYKEIDENPKASGYHEFIIEKLLYISLQQDKKSEVLKYYDVLNSISPNVASKYKEIVDQIKNVEAEKEAQKQAELNEKSKEKSSETKVNNESTQVKGLKKTEENKSIETSNEIKN
ncbi:tetratricopeptide repeat protein [Fusobacterium sp.]|uniref:tetratricopeptide repeat protein n=1 Tax=Fusobacterium sp. TaxID=68766 RepID=UPI0026156C0B|nr:tetratricopeptide repeat protein [Fusobacterium sp.]